MTERDPRHDLAYVTNSECTTNNYTWRDGYNPGVREPIVDGTKPPIVVQLVGPVRSIKPGSILLYECAPYTNTPVVNSRNIPGTSVLVNKDAPAPTCVRRKKKRKHSSSVTDEFSGWACERCKTNSTPERRSGPNGRRTLCNRCGLKWAREDRPSRAALGIL